MMFARYNIKKHPNWLVLMRIIIIFLFLAFLGLQWKLWLGYGSVAHWLMLEKKVAAQKQENKTLVAHNHAIEADIAELNSGNQALEEQARFELGMVKDDETYYQFVE